MSLTIDLDTCTDDELVHAVRVAYDNFDKFREYQEAHPDEDHGDALKRKAAIGLRLASEMWKRGLSTSRHH